MWTGIHEREVKLDAARVCRRLERMSPIEWRAHRGFPLLSRHEGVVVRRVRAKVESGLLGGYGSTKVGGICRFQLHRLLCGTARWGV